MISRLSVTALILGGVLAAAVPAVSATAAVRPAPGGAALQRALDRLVATPEGPPGVIVIVQHGGRRAVYQAGTASLARPAPLRVTDYARLASFSKAFSGAVTLSLVSRGRLRLTDSLGQLLPALPRAWYPVTLAELLQHRSGLPDFSASPALGRRLQRAPRATIAPAALLRFVWHRPLQFRPGSRYRYDNSDNVVAAMMARAVTGRGYRALLRALVYRPAGLRATSLPSGFRLPRPYLHGYALAPGQPAQDVSEALTASAAWASGGMVSTPADASRFIRAYLAPRFFSRAVQAAQLRFVAGSSGPPGPGVNAAGLAVFRYRTRCGTVYGHTGNFPGYTQFAAARLGGADSAVVTATEQVGNHGQRRVLAALRQAELLAVCAALAPS
jgi:D-alanyl-D-alanine carboxypeptidase